MTRASENIYLDHAAWAPLAPSVREQIPHWLDQIEGNPSSPHYHGRKASLLLEGARMELSRRIGLPNHRLYFCTCGTEANNLGINSVLASHETNPIYSTTIEHPSVLEFLKEKARQGRVVRWIPLSKKGHVDTEALSDLMAHEPGPIITQWVNQETGLIQNISALSALAKKFAVPLHVDAIQGFLKVDGNLPDHVASLTISGGKIGGLSGSAILALRKDLAPNPLLWGGGQEQGAKPGTANVLGALAFAAAAKDWSGERRQQLQKLKALLFSRLAEIEEVSYPLEPEFTAPHMAYLLVKDWQGQELQRRLSREGISVSVGTACKGTNATESPFLKAIGYENGPQLGIRVSWGPSTDPSQLERFTVVLQKILQTPMEAQ